MIIRSYVHSGSLFIEKGDLALVLRDVILCASMTFSGLATYLTGDFL